jgi:hypothetical protein
MYLRIFWKDNFFFSDFVSFMGTSLNSNPNNYLHLTYHNNAQEFYQNSAVYYRNFSLHEFFL